ncbi:MAG: hypothetical protein HOG12_07875 [Alphaproteobacteria bacterium]|jgi:hypothetical protein|nr:hypothetical protein [Alphaproteobacteria bacterium]
MNIIRSPSNIHNVLHTGISLILSRRFSELHLTPEELLSDIGEFFVVEPGDTISDIEKASNCCITTDFFEEAHYGSPDFVPSHEWLEHHLEQQCFEMVFIMTDDGFFTVLLIPDIPGIDPDLLSLCRTYS